MLSSLQLVAASDMFWRALRRFVPVEDAEESIKTGVPQETRRPAAAAAAGKPSGASAQVAAAAAAAAEPNNRAAAAKPADGITKTKVCLPVRQV